MGQLNRVLGILKVCVKLAQVKTCELSYLFKPAVYTLKVFKFTKDFFSFK